MELYSKKLSGIRPLTKFPKSSILDTWLGFKFLSVMQHRNSWMKVFSPPHSMEPQLIWFSYLVASFIICARQNSARWLFNRQISIRISQCHTYDLCVEISSEASEGLV